MDVTPPDAKSEGTLFGGVTDWYQEPSHGRHAPGRQIGRDPIWGCDRLVSRAKVIENQVMAISVISVSSDSSEDSVGTPAGRVILFGTIPTTIPDTTPVITPPTTQTDTTVIPTEIPIIAPTIPPSPDYTPAFISSFHPLRNITMVYRHAHLIHNEDRTLSIDLRIENSSKFIRLVIQKNKKIMLLMACNSSGSDTKVTSCSNECKESYAKLKKLYDAQREQLSDASIEIKAYTQGLKKVKAQLVAHQQEDAKQPGVNNRMKRNSSQRENRPIWNNVQRVTHKNQFVHTAVQTKTGKIPVNTARASGTNNVSTARHNFNSQAVLTNAAKNISTVKSVVNRLVLLGEKGKLLLSPQQVVIRDQKDITGKISPNTIVDQDYPHRTLQNKGIVDSGCSRHMTGNKAYLAEYQDFNGDLVAFGGSKGYITGKGIKREYSNARTPQQNRVAERKNKTFIERQLNKNGYRNKKDERGVVVRNKARLVAQGHRQEEGIDYDEESKMANPNWPFVSYSVPHLTRKTTQIVTYSRSKSYRKSITRVSIFLAGTLFPWHCKKQTIVATTTTEQNMYHFIRDTYEKKLIQVLKIHTDDNVADLLTKAFDVSRFQFLVVTIGMINPKAALAKGGGI
ncbi:hypothetical protein Tco_1523225 [Tanacetum coccineum]